MVALTLEGNYNLGLCKMALGENIKQLRKAKGWSQTELAEKIDAHLNHINKIENGKYTPSFDDVLKLANVFEVSLDYLAGTGTGKPEIKIEDQTFAERINLLNSLDKEERKAVTLIIDAFLSKKKMINLVKEIATV